MSLRQRRGLRNGALWWVYFSVTLLALGGIWVIWQAGLVGSRDLVPLAVAHTPPPLESIVPNSPSIVLGSVSPSDAWANAILDAGLPHLDKLSGSGDGLAWWQASGAQGLLSIVPTGIAVNGQSLILTNSRQISVYVVNPVEPNALLKLGQVEWNGKVVVLSASAQVSGENVEWVIGDGSGDLALRALVIQAQRRAVALKVAVNQSSNGAEMEIALVGMNNALIPLATQYNSQTPEVELLSTGTAPVPTATRVPETYLGKIIADRLNPVIDALLLMPPETAFDYVQEQAWTGVLAWSENGPLVNGRQIHVAQAQNLDIAYLAMEDGHWVEIPLLSAIFSEGVTRLPDQQVLFQGLRMEEITYWMVYCAVQRRGQLAVSYNDFGARQTISIFDFQFRDSQTSVP